MSDDVTRPLTEEERRARIITARRTGGVCAGCGRALGDGETVWMERLSVGRTHRWGPVGAGCASPEFLQATEGAEPARCEHCDRGVYYRDHSWSGRRRLALCSLVCNGRYHAARRAREARGS